MQIYSVQASELVKQASSNLTVEDAWTFIKSKIMDLPSFGESKDDVTIQVEEQAQGFPNSAIFNLAGGDNDPVSNINPQTLPIAIKGDHAIWFDANLNNAEEELEDYEYRILKEGTTLHYLVWGKLNVSKTDFYEPKSEKLNAHYFRFDDDESNF